MKDFRDKVVVITGASSGMGLAYVEEFAYLGARLALCDIDGDVLGVVAAEAAKLVGEDKVYAERVDVSDRAAVFAFAKTVRARLGPAHVVLNNAGIGGYGTPFYHADLDDFEHLMRVNFSGVVYGTKAFLPQLVENGAGALVNVSSVFGLVAPANATDYVASKFAVRGFTEALMAEFYGSDIQIHSLHPGGIATAIAERLPDDQFADRFLTTPPNDIARYVIASIRRGRRQIVYGNQARRLWLGARLLSPMQFVRQFWRESRGMADTSGYGDFNPALHGK